MMKQMDILKLKKYGFRAYHVLINGEHWGNVIGYDPRRGNNIAWTAVWFEGVGRSYAIEGRVENRLTRTEAISEVKINTKPNREFSWNSKK